MLTFCVWSADQSARQAHTAALSSALEASALNVKLTDDAGAELHFLLGIPFESDCALRVADTVRRQQLARAGTAYTVLYGSLASQVEKVLATLKNRLCPPPSSTASTSTTTPLPWVWPCDKCGDADCEYKLLTRLLSKRSTTALP